MMHVRSSEGGTGTMGSAGKIFISHAHADKPLADLLRETLVLGGVPNDRVFYSSERSTGIPTGREVVDHLKSELRISSLMIELISPTFLARPMCLMELGGAWAIGIPTFPIVVPPLTRSQVKDAIGNFHLGDLNDAAEVSTLFHELNDRIQANANISTKSTVWNEAVIKFRARLDSALTHPDEAEETRTPPSLPGTLAAAGSTKHGKEFFSANYAIKTDEYYTCVFGELTNVDGEAHEYVDLQCAFYDSKRRIVGMADGTVQRIGSKEKKVFKLRSDDPIKDYASYAIQIDSFS